MRIGQGTVARVFGVMGTLEISPAKKAKSGINRLAASTYDRDAWITLVTRLATRASVGLRAEVEIKTENSDSLTGSEKNGTE